MTINSMIAGRGLELLQVIMARVMFGKYEIRTELLLTNPSGTQAGKLMKKGNSAWDLFPPP
jgi:hypothetical protein